MMTKQTKTETILWSVIKRGDDGEEEEKELWMDRWKKWMGRI